MFDQLQIDFIQCIMGLRIKRSKIELLAFFDVYLFFCYNMSHKKREKFMSESNCNKY